MIIDYKLKKAFTKNSSKY